MGLPADGLPNKFTGYPPPPPQPIPRVYWLMTSLLANGLPANL